MASTMAMQGLVIAYFVISVVCLCERNYAKALYWISAMFLTVSILWGMK